MTTDYEAFHADRQREAERLESICEAAKDRPLTRDEVLELFAALGLTKHVHKQENFDGFDGF